VRDERLGNLYITAVILSLLWSALQRLVQKFKLRINTGKLPASIIAKGEKCFIFMCEHRRDAGADLFRMVLELRTSHGYKTQNEILTGPKMTDEHGED
jgi:hypothetical protein